MKQPIVTIADPHAAVLRTPCAPVLGGPPDTGQLITDLFDTLAATDNGVGLSAPQIGVLVRVFVVNYHGFRQAFINPVITRQDDNMGTSEEGCLSLPGVSVRVKRPKQVWVDYTDAQGVRHTNQKFKKMDARIVQHELDHLDGILITDHEGK